MIARTAITAVLGAFLLLCLAAFSYVTREQAVLLSSQPDTSNKDNVIALVHALARRKLMKHSSSSTEREREEKKEAREEELQDCAPFCDLGRSMKQKGRSGGLQEVGGEDSSCPSCGSGASQHVSLKQLSVTRPAAHKKLTAADRRKIAEAAKKIESSLAVSSLHVPKDVKEEMAKIRSSGTGWKALWGMGKQKGITRDDARFEYLAGKSVRSSTVRDPLAARDPFTQDFHY